MKRRKKNQAGGLGRREFFKGALATGAAAIAAPIVFTRGAYGRRIES